MREIKHDVLVELRRIHGLKPFCKKCEDIKPNGVISFSSGWRIIDKAHNLQPSNLEPACDLHKDELRIEEIREPSKRFVSNSWFDKTTKVEKAEHENGIDRLELGEKNSKNKTGT